MNYEKRRIPMILILLVGNLTVFISAHLSFLSDSDILSVLHLYIYKVWNMIFPPLAAILTFSQYSAHTISCLFTAPILFSLTKLAYYLPYYYEYYVLSKNMVSVDALVMSSLRTLSIFLLSYIHVLLISLVILAVIRLLSLKDCGTNEKPSLYDFSHPSVIASLTAWTLGLVYTFIFEISDTVSFLKTGLNSIDAAEISTIVLNYVLIIAIHAGMYVFSVKKSLLNHYR